MKCDPTSAGRIVFSPGVRLRCTLNGRESTVTLTSVRPHKDRLLVRIEGVDDADAAKAYAGARLFAPRENVALQEGEFLDEDLVGCEVTGVDGTAYGKVERVEHYPASDMLVVRGFMVPMVRAIVREVDLAAGTIVIDPPAGLFE